MPDNIAMLTFTAYVRRTGPLRSLRRSRKQQLDRVPRERHLSDRLAGDPYGLFSYWPAAQTLVKPPAWVIAQHPQVGGLAADIHQMGPGRTHQAPADATFPPIVQHIKRLNLSLGQTSAANIGVPRPSRSGEPDDPRHASRRHVRPRSRRHRDSRAAPDRRIIKRRLPRHRHPREKRVRQYPRVGAPPRRDMHGTDRDGIRNPSFSQRKSSDSLQNGGEEPVGSMPRRREQKEIAAVRRWRLQRPGLSQRYDTERRMAKQKARHLSLVFLF